jgi:hypothetical protein
MSGVHHNIDDASEQEIDPGKYNRFGHGSN